VSCATPRVPRRSRPQSSFPTDAVEPRFGRLYASAVLRPLAEQLVDALDVRRGQTAADLLCDGGTLGVALGRAVGVGGKVILFDSDAGALEAATREVAATGCAVSTDATAPSSCDRVASLCTFGFGDGVSLFDTAERLTDVDGASAVMTWDMASPPLHEVVLLDALREVAGVDSGFLTRCLRVPDPAQLRHWEGATMHDVVRFDGIAQYWAAMVTERPVATEIAGQSSETLRAVRSACQVALRPWTAADETIRFPVRAALWRLVR
jgi:hypothetical protein